MSPPLPSHRFRQWVAPGMAVAEVALLVLLFWLVAGWPPPEVNEAHYLAKAKHYWNPEWCKGDRFLDSADAHLAFYWSVGWLSLVAPLDAVAWIARLVAWILLACSWRSLARNIFPQPLFALLTAAFFIAAQQRCAASGEWVIGGVEGKVFAYAFVFWGIAALTRGSWNASWLWFGAAAAFHVVVGGWAVVCAGMVWWCAGRDRPSLRHIAPGLFLGALLSLPGLLPGLSLTWNTTSETVRAANLIHVFDRLRHHLLFTSFDTSGILRFLMMFVAWLYVCLDPAMNVAQQRVRWLACASLCLFAAGISMEWIFAARPEIAAAVLKYYWFRLADVLLPISLAFEIGVLLWKWRNEFPRTGACALLTAATLAATVLVPTENYNRWGNSWSNADLQSPLENLDAWLDLCKWFAENSSEDVVVLTPRDHFTFKWNAGRAEVVNWKDVPQDAPSVVAWQQAQCDLWRADFSKWYRRWHFSATELTDERLLEMARKYGFRYIVVERRLAVRALPFPRVYPTDEFSNSYYEVYVLPPE